MSMVLYTRAYTHSTRIIHGQGLLGSQSKRGESLQNVAESKNKVETTEISIFLAHFWGLGCSLITRIYTYLYMYEPNRSQKCICILFIALSMLINYNKDSSLFNFTACAAINFHYLLRCVVENRK